MTILASLAAMSRRGMPYVWGAAGPTSFDCSGLVQWSFAQAGIVMPRVAADHESGVKSGVKRTPTFFINDNRYDGKPEAIELIAAIKRLETL